MSKTTRLGLAKPTHGINVVEGTPRGESTESSNLDVIDAAIAALQDAVTALQGGGGGGGGSAALSTLTVTLTAAQIMALGATPITLLAAQGPGKIIVPLAVAAKLMFGTAPFTDPTSGNLNPGVYCGVPSVQNGVFVSITSDVLVATADETQVDFPTPIEGGGTNSDVRP